MCGRITMIYKWSWWFTIYLWLFAVYEGIENEGNIPLQGTLNVYYPV